MDALMGDYKEPKGPEWFTVAQYAQRYNRSYTSSVRQINGLVERGLLQEWRGAGGDYGKPLRKFRFKE